MKFISEDQSWLVVDKPHGISTHGATNGDLGVQEWLKLHHDKTTFVCSRLDRDTSGVLLMAKTSDASGRAQHIHASRQCKKVYHFVAQNSCLNGIVTVDVPLDLTPCETSIQKIKNLSFEKSLYEATIYAGKKHQIRRHAAHIGLPILGDVTYGGEHFHRIMLHCSKILWPECEGWLESPLPNLFLNPDPHGKGALICALEKRRHFFDGITDSFRLVHRGEYPDVDLSVERVGAGIQINHYQVEEGLLQKTKNLVSTLKDLLPLEWDVKIFQARSLSLNPTHNDLSNIIYQAPESGVLQWQVYESGLNFNVDFSKEHSGLFLDHRDNRAWVRHLSHNKRVANLFCYSGAASVFALLGGATEVINVDNSKSAIALAIKNFEQNKHKISSQTTIRFHQEDVRDWLKKNIRKSSQGQTPKFDLILCDPPTFSCFQGKQFSVIKELDFLVQSCATLLSDQGTLIFSANYKGFNADEISNKLQRYFKNVITLRPPFDFPYAHKNKFHVFSFICKKI